jgi:hypothetical protein
MNETAARAGYGRSAQVKWIGESLFEQRLSESARFSPLRESAVDFGDSGRRRNPSRVDGTREAGKDATGKS